MSEKPPSEVMEDDVTHCVRPFPFLDNTPVTLLFFSRRTCRAKPGVPNPPQPTTLPSLALVRHHLEFVVASSCCPERATFPSSGQSFRPCSPMGAVIHTGVAHPEGGHPVEHSDVRAGIGPGYPRVTKPLSVSVSVFHLVIYLDASVLSNQVQPIRRTVRSKPCPHRLDEKGIDGIFLLRASPEPPSSPFSLKPRRCQGFCHQLDLSHGF